MNWVIGYIGACDLVVRIPGACNLENDVMIDSGVAVRFMRVIEDTCSLLAGSELRSGV